MNRRLLTAVGAAVLCVVALAGCGSGGGSSLGRVVAAAKATLHEPALTVTLTSQLSNFEPPPTTLVGTIDPVTGAGVLHFTTAMGFVPPVIVELKSYTQGRTVCPKEPKCDSEGSNYHPLSSDDIGPSVGYQPLLLLQALRYVKSAKKVRVSERATCYSVVLNGNTSVWQDPYDATYAPFSPTTACLAGGRVTYISFNELVAKGSNQLDILTINPATSAGEALSQ